MIIGTGIIANSFTNIDHSELCIFASGVSNSFENDKHKFKKEFDLLKKTIQENLTKKLIYFSTISIETKKLTPYTKHKLKLEQYIEKNCKSYLILRLSNVVGYNQPPHQLISYFHYCLLNQIPIQVDPCYKRNLIDVDDIPFILKILLNKITNKIILVYFSNDITIKEIISYLENINNLTFKNIEEIVLPIEQQTSNLEFLNIIKENEHEFNINPFNILKKYYNI
jgi:nucleoside-diphosphate-sugar epimerase